MIVKELKLKNFRNYGRLELKFEPSVNILYGLNGQGKTNIIEAISVCSCLSSHRAQKDRDLIKFGENEYEIMLDCVDTSDGYTTELYTSYMTENSSLNTTAKTKRVLKQDHISVDNVSSYLGICNTVIFAPEDLNLVKGAPSIRRRFLNILISKVSPTYFNLLNSLTRLINQKNACLKDMKVYSDNSDQLLDYWDYPLSEVSAKVMLERYRYILLINKYAAAHHLDISGGNENLNVSYSTVSGLNALIETFVNDNGILDDFLLGRASEAILDEIRTKLSQSLYKKFVASRKYDVEKGISSVGIHKDDIDISLNNLQMKLYASQGQQRSAALSLKLSELDIIRAVTSTSPVLLLDDVFSELDVNRRVSLLSGMVDAQIFITCTERNYIEKELFELIKDSVVPGFYHVENGIVTRD